MKNKTKVTIIALLTGITSMSMIWAGSSDSCESRCSAGKYAKQNIIQTAANAGSFTTLIAAAEAAGLLDTLKLQGPLTLFAPTDEAFKKLPVNTLRELLKPENKEKLAAILTYHVLPGKILSKDVITGNATTVNGSRLSITANSNGVKVEQANVTQTDIGASNGVIHVIDSVLIPPTST
mgnify:CR=1 FL=1